MSDPVSALGGVSSQGFANVREIGPLGMISLRAKDVAGLDRAVKAAVGTAVPSKGMVVTKGEKACGWMSPDEYLLILPYDAVASTLAGLAKSLAGAHQLAVDVSDARAVFRIEGDRADQVLAKLAPVDLERLEPGMLRRTRVAQVAAAFWRDGDGFTLVCFRSVAAYVMGILTHAAMTGSEID
jgi:sarcosine oxidase, subunit gamma